MLKFTFVVITSVPLELQRVLTTRFEGLNELYKLCLGPKFLNGIFIMQFWCAQMSKLSKYCQHSISKSKPKLAWVPVNYCYTQQNWMNDTKFSQIRETFSYKLSGIYGPLLKTLKHSPYETDRENGSFEYKTTWRCVGCRVMFVHKYIKYCRGAINFKHICRNSADNNLLF